MSFPIPCNFLGTAENRSPAVPVLADNRTGRQFDPGRSGQLDFIGGESFDIAGSDSIAITDILANLNYDPNKVCRCMAAFTVDIEFMENIQSLR